MSVANGTSVASSNGWVGRLKVEAKRPRDGKEFVGCLVGGRQDTRQEIIKELWTRYGIRVIKHFGDEQRKTPNSIYIDSRVEIVVLLADDLHDVVLQRVLACCRGGGQLSIGINRKTKANWDNVFAAEGFKNPPPWRDGYLIDNPADPKRLEEERKKELEELEKPRVAWVDPKLAVAGPTTLAAKLAAVEVIEKYKPAPQPVVQTPKKIGQTPGLRGGMFEAKSSPKGFPAQLRAAREAKGWSQGEFAKKMKIAQAPASSWELGHSTPSYELWLRLHEIFPHLERPEGVRGQKAWEKTHGSVEKASNAPASTLSISSMSFSEALRVCRESRVMKRGPFAELIGTTSNTLERLENDPKKKPTKQVYQKLCELFPGFPPMEGLRNAPGQVAPEPVIQQAPKTAPIEPEVFAKKVIAAMEPARLAQEELLTINLRSGGTVTLTASVNLVKLRGEDRAFLFDIIDKLQAYEEQGKK